MLPKGDRSSGVAVGAPRPVEFSSNGLVASDAGGAEEPGVQGRHAIVLFQPTPSAPIAEEEDVGGTTPGCQGSPMNTAEDSARGSPRPEGGSQAPEAPSAPSEDTTDTTAYTYGPSAPDLPPYSKDFARPSARRTDRDPASQGQPRGPPVVPPQVRQVRIGVNLVRAARRLLSFLAEVDEKPALYRGPLVSQALRR